MITVMQKALLTLLIGINLSGCASAPVEPQPNPFEYKEVAHTEVVPVDTPTKPLAHVVTDSDGVEWVAFKPVDAKALKLAFTASNSNQNLVIKLNHVNQLLVQRINLMQELHALEQYRSQTLKSELQRQQLQAEHDRKMSMIENISWQIATILALAVGL